MNTAEHIVESYFRYCRKCFTISDVKIIGGVNRQIDLLAIDLSKRKKMHIESTVTHRLIWKPKLIDIEEIFRTKFLGLPKDDTKKVAKNPNNSIYYDHIIDTYASHGIKLLTDRVICVWHMDDPIDKIREYLKTVIPKPYKSVIDTFSIINFRDQIIPDLKKEIGTSNYEDEVLRTFSFIQQYEEQILRKDET